MTYRICLLLLFNCFLNRGFAQTGYNEYGICHTNKKHLGQFSDGEVVLRFSKQKLVSFATTDSTVWYNEIDKQFTIKPLAEKGTAATDYIILKLTSQGPILRQGLKTIRLDTFNVDKEIIAGEIRDEDLFLSFKGFLINCLFEKSKLKQLNFAVPGRSFIIDLFNFHLFSWNIRVASKNGNKTFGIIYQNQTPSIIHFQNDSLRTGVSMYTHKNASTIRNIAGVYNSDKELLIDSYFKIDYRRTGRAKHIIGFVPIACTTE